MNFDFSGLGQSIAQGFFQMVLGVLLALSAMLG